MLLLFEYNRLTGLNGVCSVTNKCGPDNWKNVSTFNVLLKRRRPLSQVIMSTGHTRTRGHIYKYPTTSNYNIYIEFYNNS